MSLRDDVYRKVLSGEKIYERRKLFSYEPVKAYIYFSAPTMIICGTMYLSNRTFLLKWKEQYKGDIDCVKRINEYLSHYNHAIEINKFERTNSIGLERLRAEMSKFVVNNSQNLQGLL